MYSFPVNKNEAEEIFNECYVMFQVDSILEIKYKVLENVQKIKKKLPGPSSKLFSISVKWMTFFLI